MTLFYSGYPDTDRDFEESRTTAFRYRTDLSPRYSFITPSIEKRGPAK